MDTKIRHGHYGAEGKYIFSFLGTLKKLDMIRSFEGRASVMKQEWWIVVWAK